MNEYLQRRSLEITPDLLLKENRLAIKNITGWQEAKERKQGELTLVVLCSDARLNSVLLFGNKLVASVSSIAANGESEPFKYLLNHGAIGQVVVVGHYNGEQVRVGESVLGCGGLVGKDQIIKGKKTVAEGDDLGEYLNKIEAPDAITQTVEIVNKIARLTDQPIFGAAVDHITYKALPVAQSTIDEEGIRHTIYNREAYKSANERTMPIPVIPEEKLDPQFAILLEKNSKLSSKLKKSEEFKRNQRMQNPPAVILSTSPLPLALRYPKTFGRPNSGFVVRLPFSKKPDEFDSEGLIEGKITITKKYLKEAVAQLRYPIEHATDAIQGHDFFDTKVFIIETSSLELSTQIAQRLVTEQKFIRKWLQVKGGKIIASEVKSGKTTQSQYFSTEV